jgi:hypothetical protein
MMRPPVCVYCQDFIFLGQKYVLDDDGTKQLYYHFRGKENCFAKKDVHVCSSVLVGISVVPQSQR